MKAYVAASAPPSKRRWKGFASAVLALVVFSLVVPLASLLGLHNRFPSGYLTDDRSASDSSFGSYGAVDSNHEPKMPKGGQSRIVDDLIRKFGPALSKDSEISKASKTNEVQSQSVNDGGAISTSEAIDSALHLKGLPSQKSAAPKTHHTPNAKKDESVDKVENPTPVKESSSDETEGPCELEFGSYCLWSIEHKEEMKDLTVKTLKDQLFVARAYYPSIAKLQSQEKLSREVKQNIQDHERMLSEAVVDADLPPLVEKKIQKMEETIAKAKSFPVDCNNVDKKLRQILDLTKDEAHFHMRQSAFLYHLGVQTMPKSLHCLSMRLTVEYFGNPPVDTDSLHAERINNPALHHYVIFSRNVLASSVTINSTVMNAKASENLVFHLLTDEQNYYGMKFWFSKNSYKEAVIHVLNIEHLNLTSTYNSRAPPLSFSEEFRILTRDADQPSRRQMRTEYISVFGHTHFFLPDMFKNLKKVVVLDDDVVVQQDLSPLWSLDLGGKVNGAVQFCRIRLGQLKHYLGKKSYNNDSCTWMSGLNVVDLETWREQNITGTYQMLLKEINSRNVASWRAASLRLSLLAFQDLTYPLHDSWLLSGLGKDYGVNADAIAEAAVLHYNGNMKPWLDLGVPKYKLYWKNYVTRENRFMDECNANP